MGKIKLKNRSKKTGKKKKKRTLLMWIFVVIIVVSFLLLQLISKKINPILLRYATVQTKQFATTIIHYAVNESVLEHLDENKLFTITKNKEGEIQTIDFNSKEVNTILEIITNNIQDKLVALEDGKIKDLNVSKIFKGQNFPDLKNGVVCEIPAGVIFGNALFANVGPVIPVKLSFIGNVVSSLKTDIRTYGINNAYLEVIVFIEVTQRITTPSFTKEVTVVNKIPIAMKVIQGKIPNYYSGTLSGGSGSFSLPVT